MTSRHFIKWVPERWRKDSGVQSSSLAARGLWNELLMIMHGCVPYGHLVVNGRAPSDEDIARLVGASKREVTRSLAELESKGVFSRTDDGVIYSRKYVRDEREYLESVEHGKRGGNPRLKRPRPLDGGITPTSTGGDNGSLRARDHARLLELQNTHQSACSARAGEASPESGVPDDSTKPLTVADVEPPYAAFLRMHPTLDTAPVREALERWTGHLHEKGKSPWTSRAWERNLVAWERWGAAQLVRAVDGSIRANAASVFVPKHDDAPLPSMSAARSTVVPPPAPEDARAVENAWRKKHERAVEIRYPENLWGLMGKRSYIAICPDRAYPGYEEAKAELLADHAAKRELDSQNGSAA